MNFQMEAAHINANQIFIYRRYQTGLMVVAERRLRTPMMYHHNACEKNDWSSEASYRQYNRNGTNDQAIVLL